MKRVLLVSFLSVFLLAGCSTGEETTESQAPVKVEKTEKTESKEDDVYFKDGVAKLRDIKIEITDVKVIRVGEEGNEHGERDVIAFWYDTTNLSDKDISPLDAWFVVFTAIQDNDSDKVNELNVGSLPDEAYTDDQVATIKKDGTISNAVSYELTDDETPVTLEAHQGIGGDLLGTQDYDIK